MTITNLNLRNTFTGLILPSVTSVFYIYLLKENFEQVPDELYRAAKVDGTSDLKFLCKVMIPICKPTMVTIVILKVIECWNSYVWPQPHHRRSQLYLVSNGIQEIRENGFGPGKHSCHDGGGGGHFPAPYRSVSGFPEPDHGRGIKRRDKRMKSRWKKYLAAGLLTAGVLSLTGCHGAKEEKSFELPGYL